MPEHTFGDVPGQPEGTAYASREALSRAGVHKPVQAGIYGGALEGVMSIVLSGGYEDDRDYGNVIVYTGQGGRDPVSRKQISDQTLTRGNLALARSRLLNVPIRVVRGSSHPSPHAPKAGYRYDGLFMVRDYWKERGRAGLLIWRFRLEKLAADVSQNVEAPARVVYTASRLVREGRQSRTVKRLCSHRCQVCKTKLEGNGGPYAEAAHIRPLGAPHLGPDILANLLCLCPNHHVLFDLGGFAVADDFSLTGLEGALWVHPRHGLDPHYFRYHREHYAFDAETAEHETG